MMKFSVSLYSIFHIFHCVLVKERRDKGMQSMGRNVRLYCKTPPPRGSLASDDLGFRWHEFTRYLKQTNVNTAKQIKSEGKS